MKTRNSFRSYAVNLTDCGAVKLTVYTVGSCPIQIDGYEVTVDGVEVTAGYMVDWVKEQLDDRGLEAFGLMSQIEGSEPDDDCGNKDYSFDRRLELAGGGRY